MFEKCLKNRFTNRRKNERSAAGTITKEEDKQPRTPTSPNIQFSLTISLQLLCPLTTTNFKNTPAPIQLQLAWRSCLWATTTIYTPAVSLSKSCANIALKPSLAGLVSPHFAYNARLCTRAACSSYTYTLSRAYSAA